ncbi:MAG TPA: cold shock domain-containing protein [Candidatus Dojkabacteria bacterium]|jgi:CspA family cold shock protein
MTNGVVKTVTGKGYGFISREGESKDIFYHENSLQGDLATRKLQVGDKVTFDIEENARGLSAVNIQLAE